MPLVPLNAWLAPLLVAPLFGCPSSPPTPAAPETSSPARETSAPPADTQRPKDDAPVAPKPAGPARTLEGRLAYRPIEPRKSVESYDGLDLFLVTATGEVPLGPGPGWPSDKLATFDKKDVRVRCTMMTPPPPRPDESYPMEPDGSPLARTPRCAVESLEVR